MNSTGIRNNVVLANSVSNGEQLMTGSEMRVTAALLIACLTAITQLVLVPVRADDAQNKAASEADVTFFESRVRPLLVKQCYECHSEKSKPLQGGLRLDQPELMLQGGDTGAAIVPGKPADSLLIAAIGFGNPDLQMPPAGKMTAAEIEILTTWVQRGAYFPASGNQPGEVSKKRSVDIEAGRQFWSIRPLAPATPPAAINISHTQQPTDSYVLRELQAHNLEPAQIADRRTFIRRASLDLLGLPPDAETVEAFVNDQAPDAHARMLERLLASPHYGERWGRYWLDLVRYSDILESWAQTNAQAWLYRDWVIRSLNEDLPYDEFVRRQLAADQMPDLEPAELAALGFIGLSPSYWKELKLAPDVIKTVVAEEWEERITMVSGTVLGLTVACARCHDHKFDPITTQDYYGLAGIFASVRQTSLPLLDSATAQVVAARRGEIAQQEAELKRLADLTKKDPPKADEAKQQTEQAKARIEELKRQPHMNEPPAYAVEDASLLVLPDGPNRTKLDYRMGAGQDVAMQIRGNPAHTGTVVPRRFLSVLSSGEPARFTQGSGRLEFGQAIFRDSAPLSARVMVNRVWRHHFGRGLVETPSNFGTQGLRPSHPELLDYLSERFIASGWSLKWLHREIMLSAAYQRASTSSPEARSLDPDNVWLSHMPRRRLEIEAWRDTVLSATGSLRTSIGGAPQELADAANFRRTVYGLVRRRELSDMLRLFDFPDPVAHSPARLETTTPLQQLFVLNSAFIGQQAAALAARVRSERSNVPDQVTRAHELLFGTQPSPAQVERMTAFLGASPNDATWQQLMEVLLASNALQFAD